MALIDPVEKVQQGLQIALTLADVLKNNTPTLDDEVTVVVEGQPGATKQQLYFLALAAANGAVRPFQVYNPFIALISPSYQALAIEYDAASNWVACSLKYQAGTYAALAGTAVSPTFGNRRGITAFFDQLAIYRGPQCNLNGGDFAFISGVKDVVGKGIIAALAAVPFTQFTISAIANLQILSGIPIGSSALFGAPQLPFAGQPILTACPMTPTPDPDDITQNPVPDFPLDGPGPNIPSPNPKPLGDNRSRGAVVVPGGGSTGSNGGSGSRIVPGSGGSDGSSFSPPLFAFPFGEGSIIGDTPISGPSVPCCEISIALIPLVYAALSSPSTLSDMTFTPPVQGPTGG